MKRFTRLLIVFFLVLCSVGYNVLNGQTFLPLKMDSVPGIGLQQANNILGQSFFRIGNYTPLDPIGPNLQIKYGLSNDPLFMIETFNQNSFNNGFIKYMYTISGLPYSIYQEGSNYQNYFKGNIGTNKGLYFDGIHSNILITGCEEPFLFTMKLAPSGSKFNVLQLYRDKLKVDGMLECNTFILHDAAAVGRIAMCTTTNGNGVWADPSFLTDKHWKLTPEKDLYSNAEYKRIGIRTTRPYAQFQVNSGSSKVGIGSINDAGFGYANGYIGFNGVRVADSKLPAPYWFFENNSREQNGGAVIWSAADGNLKFVTIPTYGYPSGIGSEIGLDKSQSYSDANMLKMTKMTITASGNIGIGTEEPKQKLHVMDGNILVSRTPTMAPGSKNGSILFTEFVDKHNPNGRWGIEYYTDTDPLKNGLNFWKVATDTDPGINNCMFLNDKDGYAGFGTNTPGDRLQINDGISKIVMGAVKENESPASPQKESKNEKNNTKFLESGFSYLGFNVTHQGTDNWFVSGNGTNNSGSMIWHDYTGNLMFSTFPSTSGNDQNYAQSDILNNTRMYITESGNFVMGENVFASSNSTYDLEVKNNVGCNIVSHALQSGSASLWAMNYNNKAISLTISDYGVGYIKMNYNSPLSLVSFTLNGSNAPKIEVLGNLSVSGNTTINQNLTVAQNSSVIGNSLVVGNMTVNGKSKLSGKVSIGTVNSDDYPNNTSSLFVENGILTEEVTVLLKSNWSDFVFENNYQLRSLSELENYITENKHLPDVPTNSEVESNGVDLGKMNALLLQKVEELTLYVIQLKKEIDQLKK